MNTTIDSDGSKLKRFSPLFWFTFVAPAAIILLGINFLLNPVGASTAFGIPVHDPVAFPYTSTKGIRDVFAGVAALALLFRGDRRSTAIVYAAAVLIPIGDGLIILTHLGVAPPLLMHWGTALYMAIVATFLLRGGRSRAK